MQPSRRAFLTVGRGLGTPWGRFSQRLALAVRGRVDDLSAGPDDAGLARLRLARDEDAHHALALCTECGVTLGMADAPVAPASGPRLLLDPSRLNRLETVSPGRWRAEPGVTVAALRDGWPDACPGAPGELTLAQWLADPAWHRWPVAGTADSGLVHADVLLADGTSEAFGPFGADAQRPALSGAASRRVAELFSASRDPAFAAWREAGKWPAPYRLDALWADTPNLAHVLLGGAGTLAWPVSLVFALPHAQTPTSTTSQVCEPDAIPVSGAVRRLEHCLRAILDPAGLLADLPRPVVI